MPIVDMPIEELKHYSGISPCPKDIDEYWEKAIQEMEGIDPKTELIPAAFQAPCAHCYHLYFTGVRGARVHAKLLLPKQAEKPVPAILQFHGYTGDSGDWFEKLSFVAEGFAVAALDCRGQGGLSEDVGGVTGNTFHGQIIRGLEGDPDNLLMRHIFLDTAQLAKIVGGLPQVDATRMGAMGGSQGGGLTLACAALAPQIKLAAPNFPFLCDYKRVWDMDLDKNAYEELRNYFRLFDPRHEREEEIFLKLGYIDVQNLAKRIKAKVLMATGLMDEICPPSSQFAAYNKITSEKSVLFYPDYGHEWLKGHGDIVFEFLMELKD